MGLLERQLAEEVLHSVKNGAFPDSEEVASTRLDLPSIQSLIDSLDTERENVKVCNISHIFSCITGAKKRLRPRLDRSVAIQLLISMNG